MLGAFFIDNSNSKYLLTNQNSMDTLLLFYLYQTMVKDCNLRILPNANNQIELMRLI